MTFRLRRRIQAPSEDAPVVLVENISVRYPRIDRDRFSRWTRRAFAGLRRRFPRAFRSRRVQTQALSGVSLRVDRGELVALVGRNGSGKTTLLQVLAGATWADNDAGQVIVAGTIPWKGRKAWRREVGVVPQDLGLEPDATVDELMRRAARLYPDSQLIDALLARLDLQQQRQLFVRALSGGQRRKLEIALGLVGRPRLLLLDEPFNDLDPETRRELWHVLQEERASGTAIVLSTHQVGEVAVHADRVVVLVGGVVAADASPAELAGTGPLEDAYFALGAAGSHA